MTYVIEENDVMLEWMEELEQKTLAQEKTVASMANNVEQSVNTISNEYDW